MAKTGQKRFNHTAKKQAKIVKNHTIIGKNEREMAKNGQIMAEKLPKSQKISSEYPAEH